MEILDLSQMDLTKEAPESEPERQYYYIARARRLLKELEKKAGRKLTFCVTTFGCQMNARDSEKLTGILEQTGYVEEPEEDKADFVIFNTCTVRENANQRVYGRLGQLNRVKRENPYMMIALCGCMMQEPEVVEKLKKSYRFVDLIFGTHNIYKFAELVATRLESKRMVIDIWKDTDKIVENLPSERKFSFKSGVNIMFGCNNFCSYCIVPYVRGRERSREPAAILEVDVYKRQAFIILDEAQNTTPAQMKMFLTRIGFGSKVVITGDSTQKDLPAGTVSGLDVAVKVVKNIEDITVCNLTSKDVVRHPLVQKIVKAYEDYEKKSAKVKPVKRRKS